MHEVSLANGFLRLPPEISTQVLLELRWNELLVAQRVCRGFKALIESWRVQYHIHLAIAGYEDELGSHPMSMLERLHTLKATQRCFSRMDFPNIYRIELEGYTPTYELQGGVFLQGRHLPHNLNETIGVNAWNFQDPVKPFSWRLPDFNGPIRDLTLDPSQDLLVLIEGAHSNHPLILQFLSLSTGETHPLVTGQLVCPKLERPILGFVVTIVGDLVALIGGDVFFICDWKTGKLYIELDLTSTNDVDDFFFLDEDRFVLIRNSFNSGTLEVYKLPRDEGKSLESSLVALYHLPKLTFGTSLSVHSRSDPPPWNHLPYTSNPWFTTSPYSVLPAERITILSLEMINGALVRGGGTRNVLLIVRAETLMNIPNAALLSPGSPAIVKPEMWMKQTRMLPDLIPSEQWMCYCYGSRLVIPIETTADSHADRELGKWASCRLLDFNPRLVAWAQAGRHGAPWDPSSPYLISQDSDSNFYLGMGKKDRFFEEDWVSGLPFTVATSRHTHYVRPSENMVLMIDNKRMLGLKMRRVGGIRIPHYMDVYTASEFQI